MDLIESGVQEQSCSKSKAQQARRYSIRFITNNHPPKMLRVRPLGAPHDSLYMMLVWRLTFS